MTVWVTRASVQALLALALALKGFRDLKTSSATSSDSAIFSAPAAADAPARDAVRIYVTTSKSPLKKLTLDLKPKFVFRGLKGAKYATAAAPRPAVRPNAARPVMAKVRSLVNKA